MRFVWNCAKGHHLWLTLAMLIEIAVGMFPAAALWVVQDKVSGTSDLTAIATKENFITVLLCIIAYIFLQKITKLITQFAVIDVEKRIRSEYWHKLMNVSGDFAFQKLDNRGAMSITMETSMASGLIPMAYRSLIRAPIAVISAVVLMYIVAPKLVLIIIAMLAAVVVLTLLMRRTLKHYNRKIYDSMSSLYQYYAEWLTGLRLFKVFQTSDFASKRMNHTFSEIAKTSRKSVLWTFLQSFLVEMLTYGVAIAFVIIAADSNSQIDLGLVISFPAAIMFIRNESIYAFVGYQQLANTESSITRLMTILNSPNSIDNGIEWEEKINSIELCDVSFGYNLDDDASKTSPLLINASARFSIGSVNVITGTNGSGKSTSLNLILKLLTPQNGNIFFNGTNIANINVQSLYEHIAIVEQEPFIFQDTLRNNILMGRHIGDDSVIKFIDMLGLGHLSEECGDGLDIIIGQAARTLSSGEKQRLALVRALVGNPDVILVDEVTSNIDSETSTLVRQLLKSLSKEKLIICVSHDPLLTEDNTNLIFTMKDGKFFQTNQ